MQRNSFNPTRVVLVIVLIGGLYKVGALVNPPPKGPPEPPKPSAEAMSATKPDVKSPSQSDMKKQMAERIKQQMEQSKIALRKLELERKYNHGQTLSNDDGINPQYFQNVTMGTTGFKQTEEQAAHKQMVNDEVNKSMADEMAKSHANSSATKPGAGKSVTPTSMPASPPITTPRQ